MKLFDKEYKKLILLALSGLLTGLTVVLPQVGVIEWVSMVPMAAVLLLCAIDQKAKYVKALLYGGVYFFFYYLVTIHWFLYMYPLEFIGDMTKPVALLIVFLAWVGLSLFQAAIGGGVFVLALFLFRSSPLRRLPLLSPLAAAAVWSVHEWIQTVDWWGMPNARLSVGQTELLIGIQTASLFGSYFITFVLVAVNFFAAYLLLALLRGDTDTRKRDIRASALCVALLLVAQYGAGTILWFAASPEKKTHRTVTVAAVQANISTAEQWSNKSYADTKKNLRELTLQAKDRGARIVLWSETVLPYTIYEDGDVYDFVSDLAKEAEVTILAGVFVDEEDGDKVNEYNAIVCFTPDGEMSDTAYYKRHLVPFGEFVPFKSLVETLVPPLAELVFGGSDLAQGEEARVFRLRECDIGGVVCYDAMYEDVTLDAAREGAELFCISSNDSWFGNSVYLRIHNAQARLRSVECGRYTVHSANTGISAVFTSRGENISSVEPLTEGIAVGEIRLIEDRTLYSYIGNFFVYVCIFCLCSAAIFGIVERLIIKNSKTVDKK